MLHGYCPGRCSASSEIPTFRRCSTTWQLRRRCLRRLISRRCASQTSAFRCSIIGFTPAAWETYVDNCSLPLAFLHLYRMIFLLCFVMLSPPIVFGLSVHRVRSFVRSFIHFFSNRHKRRWQLYVQLNDKKSYNSKLRPDWYCYHYISCTTWAISVKLAGKNH